MIGEKQLIKPGLYHSMFVDFVNQYFYPVLSYFIINENSSQGDPKTR